MRVFALLFLAFLAAPLAAAERIALVIGISDYRSIPTLRNTVHDAEAISKTLRDIGFDVTMLTNATGKEIHDTLDNFSFEAEASELALIYFAGHGVEVQGENFLIPVDAEVHSNKDVLEQAVSLRDFLATVDRARKMRIVILDSCRDNPFGDFIDLSQPVVASGQARGTRGGGGLAPPSPDRGTIVAFAARDGNVALDGEGDNSPFALALMDKFRQRDLEVSIMFRAVRDDVLKRTQNLQEPHVYGSLSPEPLYLASVGGEENARALGLSGRIEAWSEIRPDLVKQYEVLAKEDDDTRALYALAMMHLHVASDRYDPALARQYLEKAVTLGMPDAMYELGRIYETGVGAEKDEKKALEYYSMAARLNYGPALNDMGFFQIEGMMGLVPDTAKGIDFIRKAAEVHNPPAMFNYASLIDDGFIQGKTTEDAAQFFYAALRAGNPEVYKALLLHHDTLRPETRRALQNVLKEKSFYTGPIDGDFGPSTQRSLRLAYGEVNQ